MLARYDVLEELMTHCNKGYLLREEAFYTSNKIKFKLYNYTDN